MITAGLQEKARSARYGLLSAACAEAQLDHLLLGHTADDQAETVVMRLMRGSGVDGLSAMAEVGEGMEGITLVRPLLSLRKRAVIALLQDLGLDYVSDPSNANPAFQRVWVRQVLDEIEEREPDAPSRISATAGRMARAAEALERITHKSLAAIMKVNETGEVKVDRPAFKALDLEIRLRILRRFITRLTDHYPPEEDKLINLELGLTAQNGAYTLCGLHFLSENAVMRINREHGRTPPPPVPAASGMVWDNRFLISGTVDEDGLMVEMLGSRWAEARKNLGLEGPCGLGEVALAALPCLSHQGVIVGLPYFGSGRGLSFTCVVGDRLLGDALTKPSE